MNKRFNKFIFPLATMPILLFSNVLHGQQAAPIQLPLASPASPASPVPPAPGNGIGYATPQAALDALRKRTDVEIGVQKKWLVIRDNPNKAIWTFAPPDHPAYPAVIKRMVSSKDGNEKMETSALCQAKREACDAMMKEVRASDEKMRSTLQKNMPKKAPDEATLAQPPLAKPTQPPIEPPVPPAKVPVPAPAPPTPPPKS